MCTSTCVCSCGQSGCACAPAVHSSAVPIVIPTSDVGKCSMCSGATRVVLVETPSGRIIEARWCPRDDRQPGSWGDAQATR